MTEHVVELDSRINREITNIHTSPYQPYDMEGPVHDDISYIPLTYDKTKRRGTYVIRMEPGSQTVHHTHEQNEDFLILEGDLIEPDGQRLGPGDFVHYKSGSRHNSRTENGCLIIGFDWN